jgi:hypothetical protein
VRIAEVADPCRSLQKDLSRCLLYTHRNTVRRDQSQQSARDVRGAYSSCALNQLEPASLSQMRTNIIAIFPIARVIAMDIVFTIIIVKSLLGRCVGGVTKTLFYPFATLDYRGSLCR